MGHSKLVGKDDKLIEQRAMLPPSIPPPGDFQKTYPEESPRGEAKAFRESPSPFETTQEDTVRGAVEPVQ